MLAALKSWLRNDILGIRSGESRCACCGNCCEAFGGHLNASKYDLERWRNEKRDDLLSRVNRLGWIWVDPVTKDLKERCPYILKIDAERSICSINDTKPAMCRAYPTLAHGRRCLRGVHLK
jgi:Fe-S-cluster containining protein